MSNTVSRSLTEDYLPETKLYLAGDGPLRGALEKQVQALGLKGRVIFLGKLPNEQLPALLNKCEVFVLPSLYEGNPKALLEAMACGLPCLTSDIEGIKEIIKHNENGLLAKPLKDEIKKALLLLFKDSSLSERLGVKARQTIEKDFALEQIFAKEIKLTELV